MYNRRMAQIIPFPDKDTQEARELIELMEAFLANYSAQSIVLAMSKAATSEEDKQFLAPIVDKLVK